MLNKRIQLVIAVLALVFAAAGEELLPPCLGVGFPLLLAAAVAMARRRPSVTAVFFAVAAGAFEDALSSLPPLTSVGFFLFAAIAARSGLTPAPALFADAGPACLRGKCAEGEKTCGRMKEIREERDRLLREMCGKE